MTATMNIYHAGDLFDFKHLAGNLLLSDAIRNVSRGFYRTVLPQNAEGTQLRNTSIRNGDLELVMSCHLALFNFDGTDLDSGTVVEFMVAKMLDIPCVLLRTDFRNAGDQSVNGDPWNLMCSDYPRSQTVRIHAMNLYHQCVSGSDGLSACLDEIASQVIAGLDHVRTMPSLFHGDLEKAREVYSWVVRACGNDLDKLLTRERIAQIVKEKAELQLFA